MDKKVAIIGAGITGLVTAYYLKKNGIDIKIFEKKDKPGGVIRTEKENGFVFETGPNSGVFSNVELVKLFENLGDKCQAEFADKTSKKRLIWKGDQWHEIPSGLISAVKTPLFSFKDKLRVLGEPFRKPGTDPNENLTNLVLRRLGKSFLEYAVDPFVSGIYAGDPDYLVPKYALPKLYNLEQTYGSFIKGSIKKRKEEKTEDEKKVNKEIFSVTGGLSKLIDALVSEIGEENIVVNCKDLKFLQKQNLFTYNEDEFSHVISTVTAPILPEVFPFLPQNSLKNIVNLKYAKVAEIVIGFKQWQGRDLKAFGGLVPMKEKKNILGVLFLSSQFKGRAPEKGALLTIFAGGTRKEDLAKLNDADLRLIVEKDVKEMMDLDSFNPDLFRIFRYERAIAQYGIDTKERIIAVGQIEQNHPGLYIRGSIVGGIGIADRVKQATEISDQIINS